MVCMFYIELYVCMYLAGVVGGDRVGGPVVWGRQLVAKGLEGLVSCVLDAFDAMLWVHLDLLVTGVCSQERAASCASSSAQLQWVT